MVSEPSIFDFPTWIEVLWLFRDLPAFSSRLGPLRQPPSAAIVGLPRYIYCLYLCIYNICLSAFHTAYQLSSIIYLICYQDTINLRGLLYLSFYYPLSIISIYNIHIITLIFIFIINSVFCLYSYLSPAIYAITYFLSNIYLFI